MAELMTTNLEQIQAVYRTQVEQEAKATGLRIAMQALRPFVSTQQLDYRGLLMAVQTVITAELAQQDAATAAPDKGDPDGTI